MGYYLTYYLKSSYVSLRVPTSSKLNIFGGRYGAQDLGTEQLPLDPKIRTLFGEAQTVHSRFPE